MTVARKNYNHFNKDNRNMPHFIICIIIIMSVVTVIAENMNPQEEILDGERATMGHHYQRDMVFHGMFGL